MTAICVVDKDGWRIWRAQCPSAPEQISVALRRYAGDNARIGIETGVMTPWIVHELRNLGFDVVCLDARHARAALKMQINKNDQNDAEGLARLRHGNRGGLEVQRLRWHMTISFARHEFPPVVIRHAILSSSRKRLRGPENPFRSSSFRRPDWMGFGFIACCRARGLRATPT
jgi:Transposase